MKRSRKKYHLVQSATAISILILTGCAVGPNFVQPAKPDVTRFTPQPLAAKTAFAPVTGGEAQRFIPGKDIPFQWWTLFHSLALNSLIEQALKHNPTIQAAQAALRVSQENVYAQQGIYYPGINANFTPSRQKAATGTTSSPLSSGDTLFNLHTAQVTVSYMVDVFGGNRRQVESLQAQSDAQRFQLEAAYLSLTSNVVVAAVQEASLRAQIAATDAIISLEQQQLDLFRRQLKSGAIAEANVVAQQSVLAQTKALLPSLKKQLAQQRDLLTVLAGRFPSNAPAEEFELSMLQLPQELPVSVPSSLVAQRPDVRMAEEQLHAASAQIGVAKANMLPQFTLNASSGSVATEISQLFKGGNSFWSLAAGLTQPLFAGGALLHRKRAAEAAYDQTAAQYRATVLSAFQNVADTLQALQFDAEALQAVVTAEQAAASSLAIARRQVALGDISYVTLLTSEQAYQQATINLIQAQANRFADTGALFQALGGGWWNRTHPATNVGQNK